jgi:hypothetical protein
LTFQIFPNIESFYFVNFVDAFAYLSSVVVEFFVASLDYKPLNFAYNNNSENYY